MSDLDFTLDIEQRIRGNDGLTQLDRFEAAFRDAKTANDAFTKAAQRASDALEKNAAKIGDTRAELERATKAGDDAAIAKLTTKLEDLERTEAKLKGEVASSSAELEKQKKAVQSAADKVGALKKQEELHDKKLEDTRKHSEQHTATLQRLTGRVGDAAGKLASMGNELGTVGTLTTLVAAGTMALIVAVIAVGAAFLGASVSLAKYSIELTSVHRNQEQTLRAMTQSNEAATQLNDAFRTIEKGTGIASDRLTDMTQALTVQRQQMGLAPLSANQLERALFSLSEQEQALGNSSGTSTFIDQLNAGIITVDQLGDRMDRKFGNVVEQKMLGLDQQFGTLKANIAGLFEHVNIDGILRGLSRLVALFDSSTASGKAIQTLFDAIFGPTVGNNADQFFIGLERMILKTELAALQFGTLFLKTWKNVQSAIDKIDLGPLGKLRDRLNDIKGPAGDLATFLLGMLNPITAISQTLGMFGDAISKLGKIFSDAYDEGKKWVDKLVSLGDAIMQGIRDKIAGGADKVLSAIRAVMKGSVDAAKDAIGMHSPPRAYVEIASAITDATASTIDKGAGDVADALDRMMTPSNVSTGGDTTNTGPTLSGNQFVFHGVKDAQDAQSSLEDRLIELLERIGEQGATEAPA